MVKHGDVARLALLTFLLVIFTSPVVAECRKISVNDPVAISEVALKDLASVGVDRDTIMLSLIDTSVPETNGCWAGATGNFDGQLISVGVAQWNFGTGSLQHLLKTYRAKLGSSFKDEIANLMPEHGKTLFSDGCLRPAVTRECNEILLQLQSVAGTLQPELKKELDALFESDAMVQVQTDQFVTLVSKVKSDLGRIFPGQKISPRQVKWAIDTKVQQGNFPGDADIERVRGKLSRLTLDQKMQGVAGLVAWYEGLARSLDQDGVRLDWTWNVKQWTAVATCKTLTDEQIELLNLSFLRSRVADTRSGLYQALTFQRRAQIVLGVGSVAGRRLNFATSPACGAAI